ncbi:MAM and LDL-receptor class A domain-containing protein 2 [Nymphon striatum]|nr:MAM and LDL-receptor class A domain-containing protein 2 [Nymphon striatum]
METKAIQFLILLHIIIVSKSFAIPKLIVSLIKIADGNYSTCNIPKNSRMIVISRSGWKVCNGKDWRGGPSTDGSGSSEGGYVFIESWAMSKYYSWYGMMTSKFPPTKAVGKCMKFQYNIKGLGSQSLSIRLYDIYKKKSYVIWKKSDTTLGEWKNGQISFTSENEYQVEFKAMPNPKYKSMRGHIAVDNIEMTESACLGDCLFDSDVCTWTNANGTDELDFTMGKGSTKAVTGPTSDHTSQSRNGIIGGYIYLDSAFPRVPEDKAQLISQQFSATDPNSPSCMKFWISVYGPGIGTISVQLLDVANNTKTPPIWKLTNEKVDNSDNSLALRRERLYRIHDLLKTLETLELTMCPFSDGPCPRQCSFLDKSCEWVVYPIAQKWNSRPMWRAVNGDDTLLLPYGHTDIANSNTNDRYIAFPNKYTRSAPLDASALVGPPLKKADTDMCLALWVYMVSSPVSELGIGSLSIVHHSGGKNTTLWSLAGSQNPRWFFAQTSFRTKSVSDKISFLGIKGRTEISGIIAIDDIMVYPGNCTSEPKSSTVKKAVNFVLAPPSSHFSPLTVVMPDSDVEQGIEHSIELRPDGHYYVSLPWKREILDNVPHNYDIAHSVAERVYSKLEKDDNGHPCSENLRSLKRPQILEDRILQFKADGIEKLRLLIKADCSFDLDTCLWTVSNVENGSDPTWTWRKPSTGNGLVGRVRDHTFGIDQDGFIFFGVTEAPVKKEAELLSPIFSGNETVCLTFYYAAYSSEDGADLRVISRGGVETEWWNVTRSVKDEAAGIATLKWKYGQVEIKNDQDFVIIFKAKANISAFALDDIKIKLGTKNCMSKYISLTILS